MMKTLKLLAGVSSDTAPGWGQRMCRAPPALPRADSWGVSVRWGALLCPPCSPSRAGWGCAPALRSMANPWLIWCGCKGSGIGCCSSLVLGTCPLTSLLRQVNFYVFIGQEEYERDIVADTNRNREISCVIKEGFRWYRDAQKVGFCKRRAWEDSEWTILCTG